MNKLFSFGSISLTIIFPLIVPMLYIIRTHLRNNVKNIKIPEIKNSQNITILNIPLVYIGDLFSIIFVYISKKISTKIDKPSSLNYTEIQPVISPVKKKKTFKVILILIWNAISDTFTMFLFLYYFGQKEKESIVDFGSIFQIFFNGIFCKLIINYSFYEHHYFSMILTSIGILILFHNYSYELIDYILILICFILDGLQEVNEKYLMEQQFLSPFKLVFYEGFCGLVVFFISIILLNFLKIENLNINDAVNNFILIFKSNQLYCFINVLFILIFSLGININIMLTIFYYSPNTRIISNSLENMYHWIKNINEEQNQTIYDLIMDIIGNILIFFSCLIFNEIIICNFWGLNVNTAKEVRIRGEIEVNEMKKNLLNPTVDSEEEKSIMV
jgi:hypothetical protein